MTAVLGDYGRLVGMEYADGTEVSQLVAGDVLRVAQVRVMVESGGSAPLAV